MADEFPTPPDKLRKLVKKSRQMPIFFGFNAGTSDEDDEYLAAHARKAAELLGKIARTEGAGNKSAYGSFVAEGSEIRLTCFQTISQLAKKFKKYLKTCKITLNVVVTDPDGNVIDSDVEVLDDWFRGDDEDEDDEDDGEETAVPVAPPPPKDAAKRPAAPPPKPQPQRTAPPPPEVSPDGITERALRIRDMQRKLAALPPQVAARISPVLIDAAWLLRERRIEDADHLLKQVVAVLARVQLAAARQKQKPPAPQAPTKDPRTARFQEAQETLRRQVESLPAGAGTAILPVLDRARGLIGQGDARAALAALKLAQSMLRAAQASRVRWMRVLALMQRPVEQALRGDRLADPAEFRKLWETARSQAANGEWDKALAAVPGIADAVRKAAA